jgi:3-methyladenine DNA glycosylase AlkC
MAEFKQLKLYFDRKLAKLLIERINKVYNNFNHKEFYNLIDSDCDKFELKDRNILFANSLKLTLTGEYESDLNIFFQILGDENKEETGMFYNFYHLWPIGTYVELYGTQNFHKSMEFIAELTKRFTGEFAVRNLIKQYPEKSLEYFEKWSKSKNFHLRRLSSEGLRPKLPWASKLDLFIENPKPIFKILNNLKEDNIKFVQKSVANNINDYLKVNEKQAIILLENWSHIKSKNTFWIIKHALRNYKKNKIKFAMDIINQSAKINEIENYK